MTITINCYDSGSQGIQANQGSRIAAQEAPQVQALAQPPAEAEQGTGFGDILKSVMGNFDIGKAFDGVKNMLGFGGKAGGAEGAGEMAEGAEGAEGLGGMLEGAMPLIEEGAEMLPELACLI